MADLTTTRLSDEQLQRSEALRIARTTLQGGGPFAAVPTQNVDALIRLASWVLDGLDVDEPTLERAEWPKAEEVLS